MSEIKVTKILPPFWFAGALALEWLLDRWLPLRELVTAEGAPVAWAFGAVGVAVVLWAAGLFHKHDTNIKPFEESSKLVSTGPYRYTRNPMYTGMVFVLTGYAIKLGSLTPFFVVPIFIVFITRRFIVYEEKMLEAKFGDEYRSYKQRVSRWI